MGVYLKFQTNKDEFTLDNLQEWISINLEYACVAYIEDLIYFNR